MRRMKVDQVELAFERHHIGDHAAARLERRPTRFKDAWGSHSAADEACIGRSRSREARRGIAGDDLEPGRAELVGIFRDHADAARIPFERDGTRLARRSHPLDRDRTRSGAHIPEESPASGRERGKRYRAHLALGDLAIMDEGLVRKAGTGGVDPCIGAGDATDGNRVEGRESLIGKGVRREFRAMLARGHRCSRER